MLDCLLTYSFTCLLTYFLNLFYGRLRGPTDIEKNNADGALSQNVNICKHRYGVEHESRTRVSKCFLETTFALKL